MPVVGSTAYESFSTVQTLVRSLLNDQPGNVYAIGGTAPKVDLVPYMVMAYRKVYRALQTASKEAFIVDDVLFTVTGISVDPSARVVISDTTTPQLPTDLVYPLNLWERASGSSDDFAPMVDMSESGGLPSIPQTTALLYWEWRTDGLYFMGATADRQVRMRYVKVPPDPTDGSSAVLVRNAADCVAYFTAALCGAARGAPQVQQWDAAGTDALDSLVRGLVLRDQKTMRRRKPFGRSGGRGRFGWWF
jgi:hypothetical protein